MPVPTSFSDLSTTVASNSPAGSENVFPSLDDYIRFVNAALASIRANTATNGWVSPYLPLAGGTLTGPLTATAFTGDGSALTALSATALTTGTVPDARFPATLPAASGVNLTALNASNLGSGTVPDARFPATLPAISGANLTSLPAGNLTGNVAAARMSNAFTSTQAASGYVILPGGIMIQWGSHTHGTADGTTTSVSFSPSFNNVWAVTSTDIGDAVIPSVQSLATTGFTSRVNHRSGGSSVGPGPTRWIAIGN